MTTQILDNHHKKKEKKKKKRQLQAYTLRRPRSKVGLYVRLPEEPKVYSVCY